MHTTNTLMAGGAQILYHFLHSSQLCKTRDFFLSIYHMDSQICTKLKMYINVISTQSRRQSQTTIIVKKQHFHSILFRPLHRHCCNRQVFFCKIYARRQLCRYYICLRPCTFDGWMRLRFYVKKSEGVALNGLISKNKTRKFVLKQKKNLSTAKSTQYFRYETIKTHALTILSHFFSFNWG